MNLAVTGPTGYIGKALVQTGAIPLYADITNVSMLRQELQVKRPEIVLHLAAKSSVDYCQTNQDEAMFVNCMGTRNVAETCRELNIRSVMLSTYQVWGGGLMERHRENSEFTKAKNVYGMTKQVAEEFAMENGMKIIRTSYVFDKMRLYNKIEKLREGNPITEPVFMMRSFIYLRHFIDLISAYVVNFNTMPEKLHLAGVEGASWHAFMKALCKVYGFDQKLVKARYSEDYDFHPRPWNGILDVSESMKLGFLNYEYMVGLLAMFREQG